MLRGTRIRRVGEPSWISVIFLRMRRMRSNKRNQILRIIVLGGCTHEGKTERQVAELRRSVGYAAVKAGFAGSLHGQRYSVAGDLAGGASGSRSDDRSSRGHACRQSTAGAETRADRGHGHVRRTPGYGVGDVLAGHSISVSVELQGGWHSGHACGRLGDSTALRRCNYDARQVLHRDGDTAGPADALVGGSYGCGARADSRNQPAIRDGGYSVIRT